MAPDLGGTGGRIMLILELVNFMLIVESNFFLKRKVLLEKFVIFHYAICVEEQHPILWMSSSCAEGKAELW